MFVSSKKWALLQNEVTKLELENKRLKQDLDIYYRKFEDLTKYTDSMPSDCVRGPWCKICAFVKLYYIRHYDESSEIIYACGKGMTCSNFIQKTRIKEIN